MLCVPLDILKQHLVVLGKTGKGKSSVLRHMVEHLLSHGKRVCIVDPKGDWWGLKSSADGKSAGYPIIGFGDFKDPRGQDIPINAQSGKHVAELITSGNRPCIIGFRGWMPAQMIKFWLDFAPALFNANSGELYLVGDEFHNFAPKGKIMDPDSGKCLHWSNRIMSEGRGIGLICLIATQRPQKVHNDTLTCCETLVALGVTHASDRAAVKEWIDGCGDSVHGKKVLDSLAGLERGEAYVWSPEIKFGPELVTFPMFETFDSFAPPQLQKKITGTGWADVDLAVVKEKLATVIQEAKANDPELLKAEIRKVRAELAKEKARTMPSPSVTAPKIEIKEVPIIDEADRTAFRKAMTAAGEAVASLRKELQSFHESVNALVENAIARVNSFKAPQQPARSSFISTTNRASRPTSGPVPPKVSSVRCQVSGNGHLPSGEQKVLQACIQYPDGLRRDQLTILTTFKRSTRDAYIARLREKELVLVDGDLVRASELGIQTLPDASPLPTGEELQDFWRSKLPAGELVIFEELLNSYPEPIDRDALTERTGFKRSTRDAYLARMRAKQIVIEPSRGQVRAADELFA